MPLRDMDREQMWLLPPSLDELLPLDHPARFVAVFVDALDKEGWAELGVEIDGDPLGAPAYHPQALLCVWLYGFMTGVRSCRKLEAACRDQIPYLWLTGWQHPDHNTLWRFYKEHRQAMRRLFKRTVLLVSGRVSVPKPLSQIQRSTLRLLQGLSPRPSIGGFGFSPNPPMDGARTGEGGKGVTGAMIRARIRVDGRLAGGLQALLGAPMSACSGCGERDGRIGHGKRRSRTGMA